MPTPKRPTRSRGLPEVGAVFAMPLADGRWGACRVLSASPPPLISKKNDSCHVAACDWVGDAVPGITEPRLRKVLRLTHHSWQNEPHVVWVAGRPPGEFRRIGHIAPRASEPKRKHSAFSTWGGLPHQVLLQWRWDKDRAALLREEARGEVAEQKRQREVRAKKFRELDALTYSKLRREQPFKSWRGVVPPRLVKASRQLFTDAIDVLAALGPKPKRKDVLPVLQRLIEGFNDIDERNDHFIETVEREDICEHFYRLAHVTGVARYGKSDLADEWRDW